MMVSSKGRYALRVMLDLAEHNCAENISLKDIAQRQNISRKYLESIMTALSKSNLVKGSAGKVGGYKLVRSSSEYTVGEILKAAEGDLIPVSCLAKDGKKCSGVCTCYTLPFWQGLEEQINSYLDSYTLADLIKLKKDTPACGGDTDTDRKDDNYGE